MSHSSRFKPGPTIKQCRADGVTHLKLQCLSLRCRHQGHLPIDEVRTREDVPVNEIRWRCSACRGINVSVAVVRPGAVVTPEPIFDVHDVKALGRRPQLVVRVTVIRPEPSPPTPPRQRRA